jgi:isoamylase
MATPILPGRPAPGHPLADTIIYEVHVRGFTATHPDVPPSVVQNSREFDIEG